jgi:hypothetical protein
MALKFYPLNPWYIKKVLTGLEFTTAKVSIQMRIT